MNGKISKVWNNEKMQILFIMQEVASHQDTWQSIFLSHGPKFIPQHLQVKKLVVDDMHDLSLRSWKIAVILSR